MLGETVRSSRIKKGLTQARLARLAGVSRRHLAALEKGANVSVNVVRKVASVLELTEIQLGNLNIRMSSGDASGVNVAILADTLREARVDADRAQNLLARAEGLLNGDAEERPAARRIPTASFPKPPIRRLARNINGEIITDGEPVSKVAIAGAIAHGDPIDESVKGESALVPTSLIDKGEIVFRVKGDRLAEHGIADGDLLIVELRPRGRAANGEMVIGKIGNNVYVGHWWQKHGRRSVMANGFSELASGTSDKNIKVVAVINQIIRPA